MENVLWLGEGQIHCGLNLVFRSVAVIGLPIASKQKFSNAVNSTRALLGTF